MGHEDAFPRPRPSARIIAAEMTGRVCHAIEIAPAYVDVAVKRCRSRSAVAGAPRCRQPRRAGGSSARRHGYTIEGNRAEAMEWLLAAAEQGLPRAQSKLDRLPATTPLAHLALVRAPSSQTAERAGGHAQKIFTTLKPYAQGRR